MKAKIILAISLCANAGVLLAYYLTKDTPKAERTAAPQVIVTNIAPASRPAETRAVRVENVTTNAFSWANVESADYRDYIAKLRAIGCPEETVRDIIIADVSKLYAARVAALYPSGKDFKFWAVDDNKKRNEERDRALKRRELEREKIALIKELIGVDLESEMARWSGRPDDADWRYGFLSPERQEQLKALQDKYRDLERAALGENGGNDPAARARIAALRAQREAEMAQLLGPQDYQEYQLRNSWTARNMRESLASFQPTEDEFRKVFELRKAFDDQLGQTREGGDAQAREQRQLAQQQLEEQIRTTLGEDRYRQYQLAQDDRYRELYDFGQRNNLAQETIQSVYDMRRTAETMRRQVESDRTLSPEQRAAALTALANETRTSISTAMGEQAWKDYQRRDGGWLDRLARVEQRGGRGGGNNNNGGQDGGRFQRR